MFEEFRVINFVFSCNWKHFWVVKFRILSINFGLSSFENQINKCLQNVKDFVHQYWNFDFTKLLIFVLKFIGTPIANFRCFNIWIQMRFRVTQSSFNNQPLSRSKLPAFWHLNKFSACTTKRCKIKSQIKLCLLSNE